MIFFAQGVLCDTEDAPAAFTQLAIHFPVAFTVTGDLGLPKLPVPLWRTIALGTSVPKATIDKDRQPPFRQFSNIKAGMGWSSCQTILMGRSLS